MCYLNFIHGCNPLLFYLTNLHFHFTGIRIADRMHSIVNIQPEVRQEFMSTSLPKPECASAERPGKIEDIIQAYNARRHSLCSVPCNAAKTVVPAKWLHQKPIGDRSRKSKHFKRIALSELYFNAGRLDGNGARKETTFLVRGGRAQALACSAILWLTNGVQS